MLVKGTQTMGDVAAGRDRLVAALLALALILCHGALGAMHQVSSWTVEDEGGHHAATTVSSAGVGHTAHHGATAGPSVVVGHAGHHGGPVAHADYAAALFVVLLGAALALFPGRFATLNLAASRRVFGRVSPHSSLRPPRGPTLPLLQVFRL